MFIDKKGKVNLNVGYARNMPEDAFDASWQPTPDPRDIVIPGVDPDLPITVQTEQIDQLITLKLQVSLVLTLIIYSHFSYFRSRI